MDNNQQVVWAGGVSPKMEHSGLDFSQPLIVEHPALSVIAVNGKQQKPSTKYLLPTDNITTSGDTQTCNVECHCLAPPINKTMKGFPASRSAYVEEVGQRELDYFHKKGGNVLLFLHGFSVGAGQYGGLNLDHQIAYGTTGTFLKLYTNGPPCTYARTYSDLGFPDAYNFINGARCADDHDRNEAIDAQLNGTGSCNWLLDMEYNLNCAAAGQYPFPWETHALDYTRILAMHWNGNVMFWQAQKNAMWCGVGLTGVIDWLHQNGLKINIVAHSLGNLVLLNALQNLVANGKEEYVDRVIMWEAAVPNCALSPEPYHNPADQVPYGYFPLAYRGAKKFTVLYSSHDSVLADIYQVNEDRAYAFHPEYNLPAMGYRGPDSYTNSTLEKIGKLIPVNQRDWLTGHSAMKVPTKALFDNVYTQFVVNKEKGIAQFGNWNIK